MENVLRLVDKANKALQTADHLTYVTYPLLKETKLVITIIENLYNALEAGMNAFLTYEKLYKRIYNLPDSFESRIDLFKKVAQRYNINRDIILLIKDLKKITDYRRKSPIEFVRRDKLVICSDSYKTKMINHETVKNYLNKAKPFFIRLNKVFRTK